MLTYGQLLKKLQDLNPLELEEDVIIVRENGRAIFGLTDYRVATNHLIIGEFIFSKDWKYDNDNQLRR